MAGFSVATNQIKLLMKIDVAFVMNYIYFYLQCTCVRFSDANSVFEVFTFSAFRGAGKVYELLLFS
jgi:hypothetical protein